MKNRFTYIIYFFVLAIGQSCTQKIFPLDDVPQPVFKVVSEIDGEAVEFTAGSGGYYLFTDTDNLAYEQWYTSGKMAPANCSECGPSIEFRLFATSGNPIDPFDIEEVLQNGTQEFVADENDYLNVLDISEILDQTDSPFITINGDYADQNTMILDENADWIDVQYLDFEGFPMCQTQIGFDMELAQCDGSSAVVTSFNLVYNNFEAIVEAPSFLAEKGETIAWYLGWDGASPAFFTAGDEPLTIDMEVGEPTIIIATLASEDFDDLSYFCAITIFDEFSGNCPERAITLMTVPQNLDQQFEIRYVDENGNTFTSTGSCSQNFEQPPLSALIISEIEEYLTDIQGNPTKQFQATGNFELQNIDDPGQVLELTNLNAKIALAYPGE